MTQPTPPPARPRPPPQLSQAQAGINFIDDTDQLVEAGLIVPLSSATSRIVVVMRDRSMPPAQLASQPVHRQGRPQGA
jgi:hypothetical protein